VIRVGARAAFPAFLAGCAAAHPPSGNAERQVRLAEAPRVEQEAAWPPEPFADGGHSDAALPTDASCSEAAPATVPTLLQTVLADEPPARVSDRRTPMMGWPLLARSRRRPGKPYHPDPRLVIDVSGAPGGVASDLQRTARDVAYWPFRRCYEDGLRRDQELSGKVSLALSISTAGQVERSAIAASTLRDKVAAACIARESRRIAFSPPEIETSAAMDISLATGDEPVAVVVPIAGADGVRHALQTAWPAAEQCYAQALVRDPQAGGRMELLFRVDRDGEVAEVSEGTPHLGDSELVACLLDVYRKVPLGLPRSTRERRFTYALHFETGATPSAPEPP
jgi:hypothetical protein